MNITCENLLSLIFAHLSDGEKRVCARVCRKWRQVWTKWIIRCVTPICAKYRLGFSQSQLIQHMNRARIEWSYDETDYLFECYDIAKILTGPRSIIEYELAEHNVDLTLLPPVNTIGYNNSTRDSEIQELVQKIIVPPPATQTYRPDLIPLLIYEWDSNRRTKKFPLIIASTGDVWYGDELLLSYSEMQDMIVSQLTLTFLRKDNYIFSNLCSPCLMESPISRLGYHALLTETGQVIIKFCSFINTDTEKMRQAACLGMSLSQYRYTVLGTALPRRADINYILFLLNEQDVLSFALVLSKDSSPDPSRLSVEEYPLLQGVKNFTYVTFKNILSLGVCIVERYDNTLEVLSYHSQGPENWIDDYRLSHPDSPLFSYRVRSVTVCGDIIYLFTCDDRIIRVNVMGIFSDGLYINIIEDTTFTRWLRCGGGRFDIVYD